MIRTLTLTAGLALMTLAGLEAQAQRGGIPLRPQSKQQPEPPAASTGLHSNIQRPSPRDARTTAPGDMYRGSAPVNDECSGAITLTVGTFCSPVAGDVAGATQSIAALNCGSVGTANDDVWYKFVATAPAITIAVLGSTSFDAVVDLRSGACPGTNIGCADVSFYGGTETIHATGLTVGATYYVRVYDWYQGQPATTGFLICVYVTPPPPPNDVCSAVGVQFLPVPGSVVRTGTNAGATDSEQFGFNSAWEAFTIIDCADVAVELCGTTPPYQEYIPNLISDCQATVVYDTTGTDVCADGNVRILFSGLQPGTYYYPVLESPLASGPYTLTFTATTCAPPPANDECANAVVQSLSVPGSVTVNGDNTGATDSENIGANNVWEAFTINACANVTVDYCGTTPPFGAWIVALVGDCQFTSVYPSSTSGTCSDGNVSLSFPQLAPGTYYYPVVQDPSVATGPYSITFSAAACSAPPANDDCSGAIVLDVETTCTPSIGSVIGATESFPADSCAGAPVGDANDDVWYGFVATGTQHTIQVVGDSLFDAVVQAYSGDCAGLSLIGCEDLTLEGDTETMVLSNLNVGETYFVRVFHWYTAFSTTPGFAICVIGDVATGLSGQEVATWSVFPNPAEGALTVVNGGDAAVATIELLDVAGRVVLAERANLAAGAQRTLNVGGVSRGAYTLRMTTAKGRHSRRVVLR